MSVHRSILVASVAFVSTLAAAQPVGLDALSDDALLNDLADRGLSAMLERAFELNHTPDKKRDAIRATAALSQLARDGEKLPVAQRQEIVNKVVAGIDEIVPSANDATQLARQADALIAAGVKLDVNTLEYWGPSTTTQAQLRPVVSAAITVLDRVELLTTRQVEELAAASDPNDQKAVARIEALENLNQYAKQTRAMAGYYLALCLDGSDPRRTEVAEKSLAFLLDYDFDGNPARRNLKVVLGKLEAAAGKFDDARAAFDEAIKMQPRPPEGVDAKQFERQQNNLAFEARYFRAVVEVLAKRPEEAQKFYDQLLAWEKTSGLADDESMATANLLLEYRILRARGAPADQQRASGLLMTLLERRPELESQVMTQLRATISSDTPVKSLEPLLLRSLMSDAQQQVIRAQQEPSFVPEPAVLARGVEAAQELMARLGVDKSLATNSQFLLAVFLEAQGKKTEAAKAFIEFASAHRDRVELAKSALDNSQRLFAQLGGLGSDDPAVTSLYDQIVPLSIGEPFNQTELCYDWGYRLQQSGRAAEAVPFYRRVKPSDPRFNASRYYLMVALHEALDQQQNGKADRQTICEEILQLSAQVRASATAQMSTVDANGQRVLKQRVARTAILAADTARTELKDPARALALLNGIEQQVSGLPDGTQLLGEAMFTRIQANMQTGRSDEAVKGLVELLNKSGGEQGATIVFNMLGKLEADYSAAETAGDRARMAKLQTDRAALTPYLVQWSESDSRAEIKKSVYSYRVYDAETQRLAAEFVDDPEQRSVKLANALKLFESLDTDAARQQYKASRTTPDPLGYDPQVLLGISRIHFAQRDWAKARDGFARLMSDHALGTAISTVSTAGQVRQIDNEVYWEATARLIRSKINASDNVDSVKTFLREQYVRWADRVGGTKWKAEFDSLRAELIPDFVPDPLD